MSKMSQNNKINSKSPAKTPYFTKQHLLLLITCILIIIIGVTIDQVTKMYVSTHYSKGVSYDFIGSFLRITYVTNTGAAFGLGTNDPNSALAFRIIFAIVSWLVAFGLIGYLVYLIIKRKEIKFGLWIILACVFTGDVGNLIDRTFYKDGVIDMFDISSWLHNFGIFNVADAFVVCSVIALIIYFVIDMIKEDRDKNKLAQQKAEAIENKDISEDKK
jgi:signal peptidase II